MLQVQISQPLLWVYGLEPWPEMICRSKLYSPCLHPCLSLHLTDPYCLRPRSACLPACLSVYGFVCVHIRVSVMDARVLVCVLHAQAYVSPQVCFYSSLREWICMSVWGAPRDHSGRSAQGTHAQDPARSRVELGLHDCQVPTLRGIHP